MEGENKTENIPSKIKFLSDNLLDSKPHEILSKASKENSEPSPPFPLPRKIRWIVFVILTYITITMELDQGVLSSSTEALSKDMELNDSQLGGLGSMVFLGKPFGCLLFFTLINKLNRKYMLLATLFVIILSLILTTQTKNLVLLYLCRIAVGIVNSYLGIFFPVWTDQFGIHKYKSLFLTCHHLASSLGYLFGYIMGVWLGWELSFYIQDIILLIPIIILIFISNKYFSMSIMPIKSKMKLLEKEEDKNNKKDKLEKEIGKLKVTVLDESYEEEKINEENKVNEEDKEKEEQIDLEDDISLFEDIQKKGENMSKGAIMLQIKAIIKSPLFILINILLCAIYAIVAAVQFWINDYLQFGLQIEDAKKRFYMFGSIVVTSPPLGMVVGGIILTKIGGYESEKAIYIPLIFSLIVSIFANLAPLSTNVYVFLPLFWIYFFAGSAIIPAANGISLVSVDKKFAGAASSISILIYNVLGRFPGPNLYAFFKNIANDEHSRIPMWLLLNLAVIGFLAVLIALKFNKKKFIKLREELLKNEREEKSNFENNETEEVETLIVGGDDDDDEKENKEKNYGEENNNDENNKENNKESKIIKFEEENNQEEIIN